MPAPDPAVVERKMYVDMHLGGVDDLTYSLADLRNMGPGAVNAHRAAVVSAPPVKTPVINVASALKISPTDGTGNTASINALIVANPGAEIYFPAGTYIIDTIQSVGDSAYPTGIKLNQAGTTLRLHKSAVLQGATNAADYASIVQVTAPDCRITGGTFSGDLLTHTGVTGEQSHAIYVSPDAHRFKADDIYIKNFWGDGVIVGGGLRSYVDGILIEDFALSNITVKNARRNGFSIISCRRGTVQNCHATDTGRISGTAPMSGLDVEPNPASLEQVIDLVIDNFLDTNSAGNGIAFVGGGRPVNAIISNSVSRGAGGVGFAFNSTVNVDVDNCTNFSSTSHGFASDTLTGKVKLSACGSFSAGNMGFLISSTMTALACVAVDSNGAGFFSGGGLVDGCIARGNCQTDNYYGQFACEGGTAAIFAACISDAGTNTAKPQRGFHIRAGTTGTILTGCVATGAFTVTPFQDDATGTIANPVPGSTAASIHGAATTVTAPAAGGAGALPATPLGYYTITINGTARKVPYYA